MLVKHLKLAYDRTLSISYKCSYSQNILGEGHFVLTGLGLTEGWTDNERTNELTSLMPYSFLNSP